VAPIARNMKPNTLFMLLAVVVACSHPTRTAVNDLRIVSSQILNDGRTPSTIAFESAAANGIVEVDPRVRLLSEGVTDSSSPAPHWTYRINGHELRLDGGELRIGERAYGTLSGRVAIRIAQDGVFVDGKKRGDL
jgi:hypothetical protein